MLWRSYEDIIAGLRKGEHDVSVLYFEFAPSGFFHAGNLRALLALTELKARLTTEGFEVRAIIGIQDRYTIKAEQHFSASQEQDHFQLRDLVAPFDAEKNYVDFFVDDFWEVVARLGIHIDELRYVSSLYSEELLKGYWNDLARLKRLEERMHFYAKCENCQKMYGSGLSFVERDLSLTYHCEFCDFVGKTRIHENPGALPFRFESALKMHAFSISVQFAGMDHYDGLADAVRLNRLVFRPLNDPQLYIVNMLMTSAGDVIHKSKGNSIPISTLSDDELHELKDFLRAKDSKRLLRLPPKFGTKSKVGTVVQSELDIVVRREVESGG
jgi:lysyl-tRNA synthetase class I